MIRDLKMGKINLILVTDLSRLSRNIADFCDFYKELEKYNANFSSIKEQFDTSTSVGEMMVFNMINLAQFERKQTSERISMNFHSRAMRGLVNGGVPLLGYDRDPTNAGKRIVNKAEAKIVKEIFSMYDEGQSISVIADQLNKEGIKRKDFGSEKFRHIRDNRWTQKTIIAILRNYAFIGKREVNVKNKNKVQEYLKAWQQYQIVPASWHAIIDEKLFSKVQERLEFSRLMERKRIANGEARVFIVSGLIKCEHCGRALVGRSAHGKNKVHRYYEHKRETGEKLSCPVIRYPAIEIENAIVKHLDRVLDEAGYLDGIENNIQKCISYSEDTQKSQKDAISKAIQKVEMEIEGVFKLAANMKSGSAGSNLIQDKLQKLAEKKKTLDLESETLAHKKHESSAISSATAFIKGNAQSLKKAMKKAKAHYQKRLFAQTFQQFLASPNGLKVFYKLSESTNTDDIISKTKKPSGVNPDGFFNFSKFQPNFSSSYPVSAPFFTTLGVRLLGNMVEVVTS